MKTGFNAAGSASHHSSRSTYLIPDNAGEALRAGKKT
jgi:hypothetical protein